MDRFWWVVALGGLVTHLTRGSFLLVADRFTGLPQRVQTLLRMIPPAALAALVLPALTGPEGGALDLANPVLAGGVVALALAVWRRSVLLPMAAGFAVVTVLSL